MLFFSFIFLFTRIVICEMNIVGKIIFIPLCIVAWICCFPLMIGEVILVDSVALLFAACTPIGVRFALEYMLFPLFDYC